MVKFTHGFVINKELCRGRSACLRACPTQAIRVRAGKAALKPELCIDCGMCLTACRSGAIRPTTQTLTEIGKFKYKVALPSPVLFGQFPVNVSFKHIVRGLQSIGFDAVWDTSVDLALMNRAILDYVDRWNGPYPLISITCPVVVRLVQVSYPMLVDQLIHVQPAREIGGRALKQEYSKKLGIGIDDIAAIYISPCQAKTISILEPAEGAKSYLDGAIGISDIYNHIMTNFKATDNEESEGLDLGTVPHASILRWAANDWQSRCLSRYRYMSITGLSNIIQVFNDIEKGNLRDIEYLECYSCWDGCVGGNLTVETIYAIRSRISRMVADLPERDLEVEAEVQRRLPHEDFSLARKISPRAFSDSTCDLKTRVARMKAEAEMIEKLPGIDCGLCGAPTCKALAKDIAYGDARHSNCVFYSEKRLKELRRTYRTGNSG